METRYVVICRGPHCRERGALPLRQRLVSLLQGRRDVRLIGYACFGQCEYGPNVAYLPEATWYGGLADPDVAERVVAHVDGGEPPSAHRLALPEAERREHLRNIGEILAASSPKTEPRSRWWWPFERRGKKPAPGQKY